MRTILVEVFVATVSLGALSCSGNGSTAGDAHAGASSTGGTATGGNVASNGGESTALHSGGASNGSGTGGAATGGATGGTAAGGTAAGGAKGGAATGGTAAGGTAAGGSVAAGGRSAGGSFGLGGSASGGRSNTTTGGAGTGVAGSAAAGSTGTTDVDCNAMMPTDGGKTYTGTNVNGNVNGLNYGIWTNGTGGDITVFSNAHAFSTSWNNSQDFLAHLGLDFNTAKPYTAYGTIQAQFVEIKKGTPGSFSMIGIYGWTHNPCVEWYINEDSFGTLYPRGNVTATIDGAPYALTTVTTTGTDGANACESGHTGSWTQMISTRKTARQCGTVTVSDHFAAWANQGWTLGTLSMVHINIEVGGGTGSIDFPVANVTTTSK